MKRNNNNGDDVKFIDTCSCHEGMEGK